MKTTALSTLRDKMPDIPPNNPLALAVNYANLNPHTRTRKLQLEVSDALYETYRTTDHS